MTTEGFISQLEQYVIPTTKDAENEDNNRDLCDLNQNDVYSYIATDKGLCLVQNNITKETNFQIITRSLHFHLPPFLTHDLWKFYRLSLEQVCGIIDSYSPVALWTLTLFLRLNLSTPAVRPSYANSVGIICQAKINAKTRLQEFLHKNYKQITPLYQLSEYPEDDHRPILPVYLVNRQVINTLIHYLPNKELVDTLPLRHPIPFEACFVIQGKKYIPYELHVPSRKRSLSEDSNDLLSQSKRKYLLLVRIVSAYSYFTTYGIPECLSLDPLYLTLKTQNGVEKSFVGLMK